MNFKDTVTYNKLVQFKSSNIGFMNIRKRNMANTWLMFHYTGIGEVYSITCKVVYISFVEI